MATVTTTTRSWREIVLKADGEFHRESLYPIVYTFSNGAQRRDSGPQAGVYEPAEE